MTVLLKSLFRFGVLLAAAGVICSFVMVNEMMLGYVLLGIIIAYLVQAVWTANRPSEYSTFNQCYQDIMSDIIAYTLLLLIIFGWFIASRFVHIPISDFRYWIVVAFLMAMCAITFFEMVVTIRSCLVALERQNPISIANR